MVSNIYNKTLQLLQNNQTNTQCDQPVGSLPEQLKWHISEEIRKDFSKKESQVIAKSINLYGYDFILEDLGRTFFKSCGISPDSAFQVIIQASLQQYLNKVPFNLETIDCRNFVNGRLRIVPTMTLELLKLLETISEDIDFTNTSSQRFSLLRSMFIDACKAHKILHKTTHPHYYLHIGAFLSNELELNGSEVATVATNNLYDELFAFDSIRYVRDI
jgi:hypothetical protein